MTALADFLDPGMSSWEAPQIISSNPVIIQSGKLRPKGIRALDFVTQCGPGFFPQPLCFRSCMHSFTQQIPP